MRDVTRPIDGTTAPIPAGIVGAGRTRNGLGPFLAEFLEATGFVVRGVSGRSPNRAAANAKMIAQRLGHEVSAFPSPKSLCASGIAALAIASPAPFHLEALRAAAELSVPTLCDKPLVHENDSREGAEIIDTFARKRIPLLENCQWPYALPAFVGLHGAVETGKRLAVEMGLSPARRGREIVQNSVSHLLSIIQALVQFDFGMFVSDVHIDDPTYEAMRNVLSFRLAGAERTIEGVLHLKICEAPPRPAWLAINGCRMDRQIRNGYAWVFSASGREIALPDPIKELVKSFAVLAKNPDPISIELEWKVIRQRLDWYRQILSKLR